MAQTRIFFLRNSKKSCTFAAEIENNVPAWDKNLNRHSMSAIIGRAEEQRQLSLLANSSKAEFIAVYGRRRVGKTYLITEHFRDQLAFYASGVLNAKTLQQKEAFCAALDKIGALGNEHESWMKLFGTLQNALQLRVDAGQQTIVFLDEIPCFDTQRADFVPALDHFWNTWASHYANIKLIVCGSATSWIVKNIVDSHGGLHDRLTFEMHLHPFTLAETEQYLQNSGVKWTRMMIAQAYMAFGGIPYYMSLILPGESLAQALDRLYSKPTGILRREYERLFASLFKIPEPYMNIISILSKNHKGLTREEIAGKMRMQSGGTLTKWLRDLKNCDFIRSYRVYSRKIKQNSELYTLTDMFTIFHLHFHAVIGEEEKFFSKNLKTSDLLAWQGLAFERVVMQHIPQIKQSLGIHGIEVDYYQWRSSSSSPAAQIDLILDRADGIVNICEMKFSQTPYLIKKAEYDKLQNRLFAFQSETQINKGIQLTFITSYGLHPNEYANDVVQQVTLEDLFIEKTK